MYHCQFTGTSLRGLIAQSDQADNTVTIKQPVHLWSPTGTTTVTTTKTINTNTCSQEIRVGE